MWLVTLRFLRKIRTWVHFLHCVAFGQFGTLRTLRCVILYASTGVACVTLRCVRKVFTQDRCVRALRCVLWKPGLSLLGGCENVMHGQLTRWWNVIGWRRRQILICICKHSLIGCWETGTCRLANANLWSVKAYHLLGFIVCASEDSEDVVFIQVAETYRSVACSQNNV